MKKLLLSAVLLLLAFTLTACSGDDAPAAGSGWDTIIMGTSADFPPFEFVDDFGQGRHGQYSGIDVAIAVRIAEALGAELIIHDAAFGGLIMDLQAGTIDFIAAAMTIRPDRQLNVHFSIPYFTAMQYIVVPKGNTDINSAADLDGKIIGVQVETTGNFWVEDNIDYGSLLAFTHITPAMIDLRAGSLDAVVVDSGVAMMYVNRFPDELRLIRDGGAFPPENYGIAVRQDAQGVELLAVINQVLSEMLASGEIDDLVEFYFAQLD